MTSPGPADGGYANASLVGMPPFQIYLTSPTGQTLGVLSRYEKVTFIPRWNGVGTFTLTTAALNDTIANYLRPPYHIRVVLPGGYKFSGIIDEYLLEWSPESGEVITVSGKEAKTILSRYIIIPDIDTHSVETARQGLPYNDSGPRETIIKNLVNRQVDGVGTLSSNSWRFWPGLTVDASLGRGGTTTLSCSYNNLLEQIQTLIDEAGMGYTFYSTADNTWKFEMSATRDLTSTVIFSIDRANLQSVKINRKPPSATVAIVMAPGAAGGANLRVIGPKTNDPTWQLRQEVYVDASSVDTGANPNAVTQAGQDALNDGLAVQTVTFEVQDAPRIRYGVDFMLGDTVSFEYGGLVYAAPITEVEITNDATTYRIKPTLGGIDAGKRPLASTSARIKSLEKRLNKLERS